MRKTILTLTLAILGAFSVAHAQQDTTKVLCIGNSFTFVSESYQKLVDIAASQGHHIDMNAIFEPGYTFARHLHNLRSLQALENTGYDCVFLQDQSQMHARYAENPRRWRWAKADTRELAGRIRQYSPKAHVWLERTWSYEVWNAGGFGTAARFDKLLDKGARKLSKSIHADVSPIGNAFMISREERPDIDLYDTDHRHQSAYGSYLKACVNYQLIFGQSFSQAASNCGLDAEKCAYLRKVAERVTK